MTQGRKLITGLEIGRVAAKVGWFIYLQFIEKVFMMLISETFLTTLPILLIIGHIRGVHGGGVHGGDLGNPIQNPIIKGAGLQGNFFHELEEVGSMVNRVSFCFPDPAIEEICCSNDITSTGDPFRFCYRNPGINYDEGSCCTGSHYVMLQDLDQVSDQIWRNDPQKVVSNFRHSIPGMENWKFSSNLAPHLSLFQKRQIWQAKVIFLREIRGEFDNEGRNVKKEVKERAKQEFKLALSGLPQITQQRLIFAVFSATEKVAFLGPELEFGHKITKWYQTEKDAKLRAMGKEVYAEAERWHGKHYHFRNGYDTSSSHVGISLASLVLAKMQFDSNEHASEQNGAAQVMYDSILGRSFQRMESPVAKEFQNKFQIGENADIETFEFKDEGAIPNNYKEREAQKIMSGSDSPSTVVLTSNTTVVQLKKLSEKVRKFEKTIIRRGGMDSLRNFAEQVLIYLKNGRMGSVVANIAYDIMPNFVEGLHRCPGLVILAALLRIHENLSYESWKSVWEIQYSFTNVLHILFKYGRLGDDEKSTYKVGQLSEQKLADGSIVEGGSTKFWKDLWRKHAWKTVRIGERSEEPVIKITADTVASSETQNKKKLIVLRKDSFPMMGTKRYLKIPMTKIQEDKKTGYWHGRVLSRMPNNYDSFLTLTCLVSQQIRNFHSWSEGVIPDQHPAIQSDNHYMHLRNHEMMYQNVLAYDIDYYNRTYNIRHGITKRDHFLFKLQKGISTMNEKFSKNPNSTSPLNLAPPHTYSSLPFTHSIGVDKDGQFRRKQTTPTLDIIVAWCCETESAYNMFPSQARIFFYAICTCDYYFWKQNLYNEYLRVIDEEVDLIVIKGGGEPRVDGSSRWDKKMKRLVPHEGNLGQGDIPSPGSGGKSRGNRRKAVPLQSFDSTLFRQVVYDSTLIEELPGGDPCVHFYHAYKWYDRLADVTVFLHPDFQEHLSIGVDTHLMRLFGKLNPPPAGSATKLTGKFPTKEEMDRATPKPSSSEMMSSGMNSAGIVPSESESKTMTKVLYLDPTTQKPIFDQVVDTTLADVTELDFLYLGWRSENPISDDGRVGAWDKHECRWSDPETGRFVLPCSKSFLEHNIPYGITRDPRKGGYNNIGTINPFLLHNLFSITFQEDFDTRWTNLGGMDFNMFLVSRDRIHIHKRSYYKHLSNRIQARESYEFLGGGTRSWLELAEHVNLGGRASGAAGIVRDLEKESRWRNEKVSREQYYHFSAKGALHNYGALDSRKLLAGDPLNVMVRSGHEGKDPPKGKNQWHQRISERKWKKRKPKNTDRKSGESDAHPIVHMEKKSGASNAHPTRVMNQIPIHSDYLMTKDMRSAFRFVSKRIDLTGGTELIFFNKGVCVWYEHLWHLIWGSEEVRFKPKDERNITIDRLPYRTRNMLIPSKKQSVTASDSISSRDSISSHVTQINRNGNDVIPINGLPDALQLTSKYTKREYGSKQMQHRWKMPDNFERKWSIPELVDLSWDVEKTTNGKRKEKVHDVETLEKLATLESKQKAITSSWEKNEDTYLRETFKNGMMVIPNKALYGIESPNFQLKTDGRMIKLENDLQSEHLRKRRAQKLSHDPLELDQRWAQQVQEETHRKISTENPRPIRRDRSQIKVFKRHTELDVDKKPGKDAATKCETDSDAAETFQKHYDETFQLRFDAIINSRVEVPVTSTFFYTDDLDVHTHTIKNLKKEGLALDGLDAVGLKEGFKEGWKDRRLAALKKAMERTGVPYDITEKYFGKSKGASAASENEKKESKSTITVAVKSAVSAQKQQLRLLRETNPSERPGRDLYPQVDTSIPMIEWTSEKMLDFLRDYYALNTCDITTTTTSSGNSSEKKEILACMWGGGSSTSTSTTTPSTKVALTNDTGTSSDNAHISSANFHSDPPTIPFSKLTLQMAQHILHWETESRRNLLFTRFVDRGIPFYLKLSLKMTESHKYLTSMEDFCQYQIGNCDIVPVYLLY